MRIRKRRLWPMLSIPAIVAAALSIGFGRPSTAAALNYIVEFCIEDILIVEIPPVVLGCEIVDCCPGCPGPGPLDVRINVEGDPIIEAFSLQFENLSPEAKEQLRIRGDARWSEGDLLSIGRGETVLEGFMPDSSTRAPVAFPQFEVDETNFSQILESTEEFDVDNSQKYVSSLDVDVEQLLGPVVVNEFRVGFRFKRCFSLPRVPEDDKIDLDNNALNDNAVVLLDARRGTGCVDDEIQRGSNVISVGSVLSDAACNSEIAVFSDNDAMQLVTPAPPWTDPDGDLVPVDLTPDLWQPPVTVWLLTQGSQAIAQGDIAAANAISNNSNCGFGFAANFQNQVNNQNAINLVGTNNGAMCTANWINNLTNSAFFTAGQLNAYYVNGAFTALNCIANPNIVVVGTVANNQSLVHEFGHSFSLGHTNNVAGIPNTNIMVGGGANRTNFTEAQCFRMNLNPASTLNTNGVRAGLTRNCPDGTASVTCPNLALDVIPN